MDVISLFFVLSAVVPSEMTRIIANIRKVMAREKGSVLLFRDYGANDHAMLRFGKGCKMDVNERWYARQDGTLSYFFTIEQVEEIFAEAGLEGKCFYVNGNTENKKERLVVDRVYVQGVFTVKQLD